MNIDEIKKKRFRFLKKLYEKTEGDEQKWSNMWEIGEELGLEKDLAQRIYNYLQTEHLIESTVFGGGIKLTHKGVREVEEAESSPKEATLHFPPIKNFIAINQMTKSQIQQDSPGVTQKVNIIDKHNEIDEILKLLGEAMEKIKIEEKKKTELEFDIGTVKSQMKSPNPKPSILSESFKSIKRILESSIAAGIGTSVLPEIVNRISFLLGV